MQIASEKLFFPCNSINCGCVREFIDYIAFATIDFWYKRDNKNKEKSLI